MIFLIFIEGLVAIFLVYTFCYAIYNVFWHPLAKFPGPWWAAASTWPEIYMDLVQGGRYFAQVEAMHARYGPIVRVAPNELSVCDPEFYEHIYGGVGARRNLDKAHARIFQTPTSVMGTIDHDKHRQRRIPLANFFSKQSVTKMEPYITSKISTLVAKLKYARKTGEVLNVMDVYGALTTDIISHYAYGESFDFLQQDNDIGFKNDCMRDISGLCRVSPIVVHFELLTNLLMSLPSWLLAFMSPGLGCMLRMRKVNEVRGIEALNAPPVNKTDKPKTIFQALLSPSLPPEERTLQRLVDEGFIVLGAGLETTARFLTNITCHLLLNPDVLSKLRAELKVALPTPDMCPPLHVLEGLPYLSAVINEGLRCETFIVDRMPRVILEPLVYEQWTIPSKTVIGCSPYLQNNHPNVFPEPSKFRPERWTEAKQTGVNLSRYLGTFAKGPRMCVGINLAYAELFLTVAMVFRTFDLELVDTGLENITTYRAFAFGFTKDYEFGIKVRVTKVLD